jgi:excisionase family DNA binding protein
MSTPTPWTDLPAAVALEVAVALIQHQRARQDVIADARRNGRTESPLPWGFAEVVDYFAAVVRSRQESPNMPSSADLLEAFPVAQRLLTREQAAGSLQLSVTSVDRLIKTGQLPAVTVNGSVRVRCTDLDGFVAGLPLRTESVA